MYSILFKPFSKFKNNQLQNWIVLLRFIAKLSASNTDLMSLNRIRLSEIPKGLFKSIDLEKTNENSRLFSSEEWEYIIREKNRLDIPLWDTGTEDWDEYK